MKYDIHDDMIRGEANLVRRSLLSSLFDSRLPDELRGQGNWHQRLERVEPLGLSYGCAYAKLDDF